MRLALTALPLTALSACGSFSPGEPTYYRDVAPLFAANCQECHQANGVATALLLDAYDTAESYAEPIALEVEARKMPPWGVDDSGLCGTWEGARWLTSDEIATLSEWQQIGAPAGEPDAISTATSLPTPFRSDAVLDIGGAYQPGLGAGGNRCFVTDPQLDRDRLMTAIRVVASDPRAVAQVTLFALDSDAAEAEVNALDASDPQLGYSCFGTARTQDSHLVASWTWPTPVLSLPAGTGVRLGAGREVVVQIHYDIALTGNSFESTIQVQLQLDDGVEEALVVPVSADGPLTPGLEDVAVNSVQSVTQRMRVVGVAPRMHVRGKTMNLLSERGTSSTCLADFEHWSFLNSQLFRATNPTLVEPNDRLHIYCAYETLGNTEPVVFGDGADDEECVAYLFVTE